MMMLSAALLVRGDTVTAYDFVGLYNSLNTYISCMVYGSTPYVGMTPKKMVATLKVHK